LKERIDIDLSRNIARVTRSIQQAALEQADVGSAGEQGNHHNGVDRVHTGTARYALETGSDLTANPAWFRILIDLGGAQSLGDK
jgi:hypothetical protein